MPLAQAPYLAAPFSLTMSSGIAALNAEVTRQAAMTGYINDFALMMIVTIGSAALLLLVRLPRRAGGAVEQVALEQRTVRPGRAG